MKPAGKKTHRNSFRQNKTPCTIKGIIMKKILLYLSLCATTCLFASCDNNGKAARPRARLQVQENGDSIEVLGPDGNVLIKGNQKNASIILNANDGKEGTRDYSTDTLVPDFPADIPILPDSTVTMNQVYQNGRNAIATITTLKKTEKVIQFYEEQIPLKGWEPGARFDLDNIIMLNGTHNKASLNISITSEDETTTINIARTEATD